MTKTQDNKLPKYDYFAARNCLREIASHYPKMSHVAMKGYNFVTPELVARVVVGNAHVELSFGKGMGDYATYGITVYDRLGVSQYSLSRALFKLEDVENYLRLIKQVTTFGE